MRISALRLFNVKRFAGRGVAIEGIGDGVNVLCAANEFGKSTSFEALHALFFQSHSSTAGDVRAIRPYSGGNPLIEADVATDAGRYRITKQFYGGRSARVVELERFPPVLTRGGFPRRRGSDSYVDAPYGKGFLVGMGLIGCFHMSGLFVRRIDSRWP
jgi:hypothetical protein